VVFLILKKENLMLSKGNVAIRARRGQGSELLIDQDQMDPCSQQEGGMENAEMEQRYHCAISENLVGGGESLSKPGSAWGSA